MAIVARISENDIVQMMKLKTVTEGSTSIPEISKKKSIVDENAAELLVNQALNEIFRSLYKMSCDYKKIVKYGHRLVGEGKDTEISKLLAINENMNT